METTVSDDLLLNGIDEMPGGFVVTDPNRPDNPIIFASNGFSKLTGYDIDAIEGRNCRFLQGPETDSDVVAEIREAIDEAKPIATIVKNYRQNGDAFWNQLFIIPTFDDDGTLDAFFGFQRDITEQIEAEEKVAEQLANFKEIMTLGKIGGFAIELQNGQLTLNSSLSMTPGAEELCGLGPNEQLSFGQMLERLSESDEETLREMLSRAIETNESVNLIIKCKDDELPGWIEIYAEPVLNDDLVVTGITGAIRDVTEIKDRERELVEFRNAIEHAAHAVYLTDEEGLIEYVNPAFEDITGFSEAEAVGATPSILNSGSHGERYYNRLWRTIREGYVWREEIIDRRKSGELYHADQTIAPIFDDSSDTITGYVALHADVTDRKLREQELHVLHRILRHNLRNRLNIIQGYAENLSEDNYMESKENIVNATSRLLRLTEKAETIEQFLRQEVSHEPHIVANLLDPVIEDFQKQYPDVQIVGDIPEGIAVNAGSILRVAVREVIQNAIQHSDLDPSDIEIGIRVRRINGQDFEITIEDNGPGIDDLEQIPARGELESQLEHGSGIGLWMVNWVITRLGGKLDFRNPDDRGVVVAMRLPESGSTIE